MAKRSFTIAAATTGTRAAAPAALLTALGLPSTAILSASNRLYFQNVGDDFVTVYTSPTGARPANFAAASDPVLRLGPGQRDYLIPQYSHTDFATTHPTDSTSPDIGQVGDFLITDNYFIAADTATTNVVVEPT